jgi:hypothetical protein
MGELDGLWDVRRLGGLLPPLLGVTKKIDGDGGETRVAGLPGVSFHVAGRELRYRRPFAGFVDRLEPAGPDRWRGEATFRGRVFGRFELVRTEPAK